MKLTDLIVSPKSLGDKLWLVDVSPAYEYKDGKRTDTVLGYRYSVALPEKGLDKVDVRIDGQQQTEAPNGYVEVRFDGLEVFIYWSKGLPCGGKGNWNPYRDPEALSHWAALGRRRGKTIPIKGSVPRRQRSAARLP